VDRITTKRAPDRSPPPSQREFSPSPLLLRLHAGLTAVLLLGYLALVLLAAFGQLHFGHPPTASADVAEPREEEGAKVTEKDEKQGRYQIELLDDARQVLGEAGKLGILGERLHEAWVFRYRGGLLECKLETDFGGKAISAGQVPEDWSRFLTADQAIKQGKPEALNKEGYIVLLGMAPVVSVDQALQPLHPHLGAMFTAGPAGPLHALVPYYHEVWRRREYRLFLSAGPPRGKTGPGFNLWTGDLILVRSHFVNDDSGTEPSSITAGKDLEAGKDLTIMERQRGLTTIRLKAKFLSDKEAMEMAKKE
jgi:hypothetical protein